MNASDNLAEVADALFELQDELRTRPELAGGVKEIISSVDSIKSDVEDLEEAADELGYMLEYMVGISSRLEDHVFAFAKAEKIEGTIYDILDKCKEQNVNVYVLLNAILQDAKNIKKGNG